MVSLAVLGTLMMGGMGVGVFTNAGLVNSEIKEKCKIINELYKEIYKVRIQGIKLVNGFHEHEDQLKELNKQIQNSIDVLKKKIDEFKDKNKKSLDREEYIYTAVIITVILIILTKMVLSTFFKENIK